MFEKNFKFMCITFLCTISIFQNTLATTQTSEVDLSIENFLISYPTLFYKESEQNDLINSNFQENANFETLNSFSLYDIDGDKIPEIIVDLKLEEEGGAANIYKYDGYEKKYVLSAILDSSYKFYTDSKGRYTVFEGSEMYSDGIKYSYLKFDGTEMKKTTMYYDGEEYFNKINSKTYDSKALLNNNKILDQSINLVPEINKNKISDLASKSVRKNLNLEQKNKKISVLLNNKAIDLPVEPCIINSRTMLPARAIADNFNAITNWDGKNKIVTITNGNIVIKMTIDNNVVTVNGVKKTLDTAPTIINDKTLVPMRFIIETLGGKVSWVDSTKTANIVYYPSDYIQSNYFNELNYDVWSEEINGNFKNTYKFKDESSGEKVAIWSNKTITNLEIIRVDWKNDKFVDGKSLYKLEKLTPLDLLVIDTIIPEGIPTTKVRYIDENGKPSNFIISYNGKFGGVWLIKNK